MPSKLSEGRQARYTHSLATHGSRLTDGLGRRLVGLAQGAGPVGRLVAPLRDPTLTVYSPGDLRRFHARGTPAWAFDFDGNLRQYATGELRIVPSPAGLPAALREPTSTNLALRSQDLADPAWSKNGAASITSDAAVAPDLTVTADKICDATAFVGSKQTVFQNIAVVASTTYAITQFFQAAEYGFVEFQVYDQNTPGNFNRFPVIDLTTGAVPLPGGSTLGTNLFVTKRGAWWECTHIAALGAATTVLQVTAGGRPVGNNGAYNGVVGNGIYAWQLQVEAQAFATSPIPTLGAAATRGRDEIVIPLDVRPGQPLSLIADYVIPAVVPGLRVLVTSQTGVGSTVAGLMRSDPTGFVTSDNNSQISTANVEVRGGRTKAAYAHDGVARSIVMNGGAPVADTATQFGRVATLVFGQSFQGLDQPNDTPLYVHEFRTWRRRVPSEQLRLLTQ
ncbi:MAG: hypothetical protein JWQ72_3199 [Polaromonas sp.]|nr:hypothetical protein [Polaromonas sp.]